MPEIPYGYCHCGCGEKTGISPNTEAKRGRVKGQPYKYVKHHRCKMDKIQIDDPNFYVWFMQQVMFTPYCWLWTGRLEQGYGRVYVDGKYKTVHKLSYIFFKGEIPKGMVVRHTCDVPNCVNPDHLLLGTDADNMKDRDSRYRQARGERQGCAKLTWGEVDEIRKLYAAGGVTMMGLAIQFNMSDGVICKIIHNKLWRTDLPREAN
jgi:hypothetical protein